MSGGGEKGGGGGLREIRRHPHGVSAVQGGGLMDTSIGEGGRARIWGASGLRRSWLMRHDDANFFAATSVSFTASRK